MSENEISAFCLDCDIIVAVRVKIPGHKDRINIYCDLCDKKLGYIKIL